MKTVAVCISWRDSAFVFNFQDKLRDFQGVLSKLEDGKDKSKPPEVHSLSDAKSQLEQAEDAADGLQQHKVLYSLLLQTLR